MPCQACGRNAPTKYVEFYQNIGMLVVRRMRSIRGNLCKRCIRKYFLNMTGLTLVTGWWGMISLILNPFLIIANLVRYLGSLAMADGGEAAMPLGQAQRIAAAPGNAGAAPHRGSSPTRPPAPSAGSTPHPLASYRHDIVLRLRGGESPAQIAAFIAPRAGLPPATVHAYVESLRPNQP